MSATLVMSTRSHTHCRLPQLKIGALPTGRAHAVPPTPVGSLTVRQLVLQNIDAAGYSVSFIDDGLSTQPLQPL
eukprot:359094-Chlamydomonas_euryale.AAC.10